MARIAQRGKKSNRRKTASNPGIIGRAQNFVKGIGSQVRNQDMFGLPIPLNYNGDDTFKTIIGVLLSIFMLICLLAYTMLKFQYMVDTVEWNLIQQNLMTSKEELQMVLPFQAQVNSSISL